MACLLVKSTLNLPRTALTTSKDVSPYTTMATKKCLSLKSKKKSGP